MNKETIINLVTRARGLWWQADCQRSAFRDGHIHDLDGMKVALDKLEATLVELHREAERPENGRWVEVTSDDQLREWVEMQDETQ